MCYSVNMSKKPENKPTGIRFNDETRRLLELLMKDMDRTSIADVIRVLVKAEAERRNLK